MSIFLGLGMMGLTVAKRDDLVAAAETIGLFRRRDATEAATRCIPSRTSSSTRSVLIDGRVADIVESGFLYGTLVVPRFVLAELQHIADSSDALRRNRGRRGLDILARMQKDSPTPDPRSSTRTSPEARDVDAKLVTLARTRSRTILTNDFNLNKVADLQGIRVLERQCARQRGEAGRAARARSCTSASPRRARSRARASPSSTTAR